MTHALAPTFTETYAARLLQTEDGIDALCSQVLEAEEVDAFTHAALEGYAAMLQGPGKRIRGVLTITGYELGRDLYPPADGSEPLDDRAIATGAAGAMEALHAYLLGFDDMADRADLRRGLPTVHTHMNGFLQKQGVEGDAAELARSYTEIAGLILQHEAQAALLSLPAPPANIQRAGYILNRGLTSTGRGQGRDMLPQGFGVGLRHALQTATDKTAHYTFALPLQVGAALAGAPLSSLQEVERYAFFSGLAFQVRDDIISTFGDPATTGKDALSDVREGKETILVALARDRANERGQQILRTVLGNMAVKHADVQALLGVIRETGALDIAGALVDRLAQEAVASIPQDWPELHTQFLRDLALSGAQREK